MAPRAGPALPMERERVHTRCNRRRSHGDGYVAPRAAPRRRAPEAAFTGSLVHLIPTGIPKGIDFVYDLCGPAGMPHFLLIGLIHPANLIMPLHAEARAEAADARVAANATASASAAANTALDDTI